MTHAKRLLDKLIKQRAISEDLSLARIVDRWGDTVGAKIAKNTRPQRLQKGELVVSVASSPWLTELGFLKKQIRETINSAFGQRLVKSIKLRMDSNCQGVDPRPTESVDEEFGPVENVPVPSEVEDQIAQDSQIVPQAELRESIEKARRAQVRRELAANMPSEKTTKQ